VLVGQCTADHLAVRGAKTRAHVVCGLCLISGRQVAYVEFASGVGIAIPELQEFPLAVLLVGVLARDKFDFAVTSACENTGHKVSPLVPQWAIARDGASLGKTLGVWRSD
jgi:hypothetical protein